jgi:hypothetical protein
MFTLSFDSLTLHGLHGPAAAECGNSRCETGEECTSLDCRGGAQCQMDCPLSRPQCPKTGSLVRVTECGACAASLRLLKCVLLCESSDRRSALVNSSPGPVVHGPHGSCAQLLCTAPVHSSCAPCTWLSALCAYVTTHCGWLTHILLYFALPLSSGVLWTWAVPCCHRGRHCCRRVQLLPWVHGSCLWLLHTRVPPVSGRLYLPCRGPHLLCGWCTERQRGGCGLWWPELRSMHWREHQQTHPW